MIVTILALAMLQQPCPITVGIAPDGALFFDRFSGWYKTTPKMVESVVKAGCFPDEDRPRPITSVRLEVAANAPKSKVGAILALLARDGWEQGKINIRPWSNYPHKPR